MSEDHDRSFIRQEIERLLERVPFAQPLRRDVAWLRRCLLQPRPARIAAIGKPRSGRTRLFEALLQAKDTAPSVGGHEGNWLHATVNGKRLDWQEVAPDVSAANLEAVAQQWRQTPPDVLLWLGAANQGPAFVDECKRFSETALGRAGVASRPPVCIVITKVDAAGWPEEAETGFDAAEELAAEAERRAGSGPVRVVPVSAETGRGLRLLARALYARLPEVAQLEGARALVLDRNTRKDFAEKIVRRCASVAVTVGLTPIPFSDALLLWPLQLTMVRAIAVLGGQPRDKRALYEWLASLGVVGGAGLGFRWTARQVAKFVPGAGTVVSAGVAGAGTMAVGRSAIRYFLEGPGRRFEELP